jgi:hypothetical protein
MTADDRREVVAAVGHYFGKVNEARRDLNVIEEQLGRLRQLYVDGLITTDQFLYDTQKAGGTIMVIPKCPSDIASFKR